MLKILCHEVALPACCRSNWKGFVDARGRECSLHHGNNRHTDSTILTVLDDEAAMLVCCRPNWKGVVDARG